jgi:hypothetical protein
MEKTSETKIYKIIRELKVVTHKKRQEFLVEMIAGLIKSRSVIFLEIADKMTRPVKAESLERRIQDFFQKVNINYTQLILFYLSFIHHKSLTLSIDRTEWDFGKTQINILCVVASIGKMAVPIYFEMLDNKSGNSNYQDRIQVLQHIIKVVGLDKIDLLIMDREFIGHKWLRWLKKQKIPFCVRVPKSHKITFADGQRKTAEELLGDKKRAYYSNVYVNTVQVNVSLSYDENGDLLYLIGTERASQLKNIYRKRWTIEVFFQALKSRGFNLEKSCIKSIKKYRKLFAVVAIAYTICWATGIEDGRTNPVRVKKHGYPQYSIFRRGLNLMRSFYKNNIVKAFEQALDKARSRLIILKTIG